ncbi:hypothetical protein D3C86_1904410 [compost metagenome]
MECLIFPTPIACAPGAIPNPGKSTCSPPSPITVIPYLPIGVRGVWWWINFAKPRQKNGPTHWRGWSCPTISIGWWN